MDYLILIALIAAIAIGVYFFIKKAAADRQKKEEEERQYAQAMARVRRAENKCDMSDPISREDIEYLRWANSPRLDEAIMLRRRQIEQGVEVN